MTHEVYIYNWASHEVCNEKLKELGYKSSQTVHLNTDDLFNLAKEFYNAGLQVMVTNNAGITTLSVDYKRNFTTR